MRRFARFVIEKFFLE